MLDRRTRPRSSGLKNGGTCSFFAFSQRTKTFRLGTYFLTAVSSCNLVCELNNATLTSPVTPITFACALHCLLIRIDCVCSTCTQNPVDFPFSMIAAKIEYVRLIGIEKLHTLKFPNSSRNRARHCGTPRAVHEKARQLADLANDTGGEHLT